MSVSVASAACSDFFYLGRFGVGENTRQGGRWWDLKKEKDSFPLTPLAMYDIGDLRLRKWVADEGWNSRLLPEEARAPRPSARALHSPPGGQ